MHEVAPLEDWTLYERPLSSRTVDALTDTALGLCGRVDLAPQQLYRLVGVELSNFQLGNEETVDLNDAPLLAPQQIL